MIPYGRQNITQDDIDAVVDVLQSDFLTQGPAVPAFERSVADYCGATHAVAVNSATSALHIACLSLGLGPGDWLWTSPITFVASANCGLYCGATVDFVDIDPRTYNLCPQALEQKLLSAEKDGKLPKVVVAVHLSGQACDMETIYKLSLQYGFKVIEDASHAIGGKYKGEHIGNCRYSDITVFSFHPVKIITTAEGGMALTNDDSLATKMNLYRSQGVTRDADKMTHRPDGPWYYQQIELGYNYRMTELQAALGISQMKRLDEYVARRHTLAALYDSLLESFPVICPWQNTENYSSYHLYIVRIPPETAERRRIFTSMRERGIGVNVHYIPVHTQPYYSAKGFKKGDFPTAEQYYREAISLPIYPLMNEDDQLFVVDALAEAFKKYQSYENQNQLIQP